MSTTVWIGPAVALMLVGSQAWAQGAAPAAGAGTPKKTWVGVGGFTGSGKTSDKAEHVGAALQGHDLGTAGNDQASEAQAVTKNHHHGRARRLRRHHPLR